MTRNGEFAYKGQFWKERVEQEITNSSTKSHVTSIGLNNGTLIILVCSPEVHDCERCFIMPFGIVCSLLSRIMILYTTLSLKRANVLLIIS